MINNFITALYGIAKSLAYAVLLIVALFFSLTAIRSYAVNSPLESSIVKVTNNEGTGGGTGWVTKTSTGKRVIVTNDHVCQVASNSYIRIEDDTGKPSIKRILKSDPNRDLCVIEGVDAPALALASRAPTRFESLTVYGHPLLNPTTPSYGQYVADGVVPVGFSPNAEGKCDAGELMSLNPQFPGPRQPPSFIQPFAGRKGDEDDGGLLEMLFPRFCLVYMELSFSTAIIYPGNSGSPVTNSDGDVVGVMNSASPQDNRGNFIPLTYVREILEGV